MRLALATCAQWPDLDDDDALLFPAFEALGITASPAVWDDPTLSWNEFDAVVLRETWDYAERRDEFLEWARRVAQLTTVINPLPIITWSSDKHYLLDLVDAGVPCVPTIFIEPNGTGEWEPPGADEFVVKPAVSAGSRNTERYASAERELADEHVRRILAEGRSVMVQPYLARVDCVAETAMVYFGGKYSHAARKGPLLMRTGERKGAGGLFLEETIDPCQATPDHLAVGQAALEAAISATGELPSYARIDLVEDDDGHPVVLEVEMVEPSAFLRTATGAADRFARAIAARCDGLR